MKRKTKRLLSLLLLNVALLFISNHASFNCSNVSATDAYEVFIDCYVNGVNPTDDDKLKITGYDGKPVDKIEVASGGFDAWKGREFTFSATVNPKYSDITFDHWNIIQMAGSRSSHGAEEENYNLYTPNIALIMPDYNTYFIVTAYSKSSGMTAEAFATKFNTDLGEICEITKTSGYNETLGNKWIELAEDWATVTDKDTVKTSALTLYATCRDKYTYILVKYYPNHSSTITDFMGLYTNDKNEVVLPYSFNLDNNELIESNSNNILIILLSSLSIILVAGGYFLIKRKREE